MLKILDKKSLIFKSTISLYLNALAIFFFCYESCFDCSVIVQPTIIFCLVVETIGGEVTRFFGDS